MLTIWGRENSINVQKVLWCCEEAGVAYRRIDAGGRYGVVDTPEYRALNPNGRVPTIDDDGFVLWESNAIVRYLAAKHARGSLWPEALATRADADRWMDWMSTTFWPAMHPLFHGLVRTPPAERDAEAIEQSRLRAATALAIADRCLAARAFLAGEELTMGDIPLGCAVWRWKALPIERPELANVARWFAALEERAGFRKVVMLPLS